MTRRRAPKQDKTEIKVFVQKTPVLAMLVREEEKVPSAEQNMGERKSKCAKAHDADPSEICVRCGYGISWQVPILPRIRNDTPRLPRIEVTIAGVDTSRCYVDTGSTRTTISQGLANKIWGDEWPYKLGKTSVPLVDASERRLITKGDIKVPIKIGPLKFHHTVTCLESPPDHEEFLIGYDILTKHKLGIVAGKILFAYPDKKDIEISHRIKDILSESLAVVADESVAIARGQGLTPVRVRICAGKQQQQIVGERVIIHCDSIHPEESPELTDVVYTVGTVETNNIMHVYLQNTYKPLDWIINEGDLVGTA